MKHYHFPACAAALAAVSALTACSSGGISVKVEQNGSAYEITACGMAAAFPEGWTVLTGDEVYEMMITEGETDYSDAESLKSAFEAAGTSYVFYAENAGKTAHVNITALSLDAEESDADTLSLRDYAQTTHNTTVLGWQMDGYALSDTGFDAAVVGGTDGFLSQCDVYSDETLETLLLSQQEFIFEFDGCYCSLQTYAKTDTEKAEVAEILAGITAK